MDCVWSLNFRKERNHVPPIIILKRKKTQNTAKLPRIWESNAGAEVLPSQ